MLAFESSLPVCRSNILDIEASFCLCASSLDVKQSFTITKKISCSGSGAVLVKNNQNAGVGSEIVGVVWGIT